MSPAIPQYNVGVGYEALWSYSSGGANTALGYQAMFDATTTASSTVVGYRAGLNLQNGSNYNTLIGYQAGYGITTGADNILIGSATSSTANANLTTGSQNILIGENEKLPSATGNGQLDIGNDIFGTGITGTGSTLSKGDIGIGTTTPYSYLEVWGPDTASTSAFAVVNNASTTVFSVLDNGNSTYSGSIFQSSDQRLKTDVQTLDASSSLSLIDQLNPVSYFRLDQPGTGENLGFLAQQVGNVLPELVSTTSPTALTPDGTLTLNYEGLISPIVSAIQALSAELASIENTIAGFAQSFTTDVLNSQQDNTQKLCVGATCVTPAQFQAIVAAANVSQSSEQGSGAAPDSGANTTPDTPPVLQINGDNPAAIQIGGTYNDLGATVTGPQADLNLGIQTYLNGTLTSNIVIDTTQVATDTIDYVATDQNGLTSTSTRTVIIEASPSIVPTDSASTTEASSTPQ